jgi:signal transduction histidine kinase
VRDNGPGFDPQSIGAREQQGHFGLRGMIERLESVGGAARIETALGGGTTVLLTAPCLESAAAEQSSGRDWWG